MVYFLRTVGYYTFDDADATPCPYKLLIGSEKKSTLKDVSSDEDMKESIRNHVQTGHHPASTCAMGSDNNKLAVLDEKLRVKGIKNLRVVDASSFPDMISGNINASVIMLAEKAADMILQNIN